VKRQEGGQKRNTIRYLVGGISFRIRVSTKQGRNSA
jgi:hypothetical protein